MTALDRALDALAAAPACDASYEPAGTNDPSKCWRCLGPAGSGASGVCDACREVLLGDGPIEPANEGWRSWGLVHIGGEIGADGVDRRSFAAPPMTDLRYECLDCGGQWYTRGQFDLHQRDRALRGGACPSLAPRSRAFMRRDGDEEWIEVPVNEHGGVASAAIPAEALTSGTYMFRIEPFAAPIPGEVIEP